MAILAGFHVEGWDHLILRSFIAVLLGIPEDEIIPDWIDASGRGWEFVLQSRSFALFAEQVEQSRALILGPRDCWGPGDAGAER